VTETITTVVSKTVTLNPGDGNHHHYLDNLSTATTGEDLSVEAQTLSTVQPLSPDDDERSPE
jgi:hypothetical protein